MKIDKLTVGQIQTNCYIVSSVKKNTILIDPGDEAVKLIRFIEMNELTLRYILITHGHFDHIMALEELVKKYHKAKVCISGKDIELIENLDEQIRFWDLDYRYSPRIAKFVEAGGENDNEKNEDDDDKEKGGNNKESYDDGKKQKDKDIKESFNIKGVDCRFLKDGDEIILDDLNIKTIETPGHTKGGLSFILNKEYFFSGDTLFKNAVGRTDLYGGDRDILGESLKRISELPDRTMVYPGHGEATTIGEEREWLLVL